MARTGTTWHVLYWHLLLPVLPQFRINYIRPFRHHASYARSAETHFFRPYERTRNMSRVSPPWAPRVQADADKAVVLRERIKGHGVLWCTTAFSCGFCLFLFHCWTALVRQSLFIVDISIPYTVTQLHSPHSPHSSRRTDLYLTTQNTHRIRTRSPSSRAAADPRLRPHGHWDRRHVRYIYLVIYFTLFFQRRRQWLHIHWQLSAAAVNCQTDSTAVAPTARGCSKWDNVRTEDWDLNPGPPEERRIRPRRSVQGCTRVVFKKYLLPTG